MKKGVEMSLQVIVIAAIVLLIGAILIYISGTRLGLFGRGVADCTSKGGHCVGECLLGEQWYSIASCPIESDRCCIKKDILDFGQQGYG